MSENFIPLSIPNLKGNEMKYLRKALESQWVSTGGAYITEFEEKMANYVKVKGAVSCQNGTSGLHISLIIAGVTNNDMVIVPSLTFIAAVNPVKYIDAQPIFMDCDDSLCIDPIKLEEFCENECALINGNLIHKTTNKHIKAIIIVHVFGNMADMEKLVEISKKYNLIIIEDATEALGTYYTDRIYKGNFAGTIGDIGVYSFNGNKIITTGGGGMIVSNNQQYLNHAKHLTTQAKSDEIYYTHDEIGYNYRMTNIQAAIGLGQLEQLEAFIKIKNENYDLYIKEFKKYKIPELLPFRENIRSNKWFYAFLCDKYKLNRDELINYLSDNKIQSRPIWGLIHEQKPYIGSYTYKIEKAYYYWEHIVNIPCSTNLTDNDIFRVIKTISDINLGD